MIRYYFNSSGQNNLKQVEEDVKTIDKEFQEMADNVEKYTNEFEKIDPDVQFIQNRMKSNNKNLQELIDKMYQNIKQAASEAGGTENIEDRIAFVRNKLQPTLLEFQSTCLVEMDDILGNVLGKTSENNQ